MKKSLIALAVAAALVPSLAMAEAGDIVVRLRATNITANEDSKLGKMVNNATGSSSTMIPGAELKVDSNTIPEIDFSYYITKNIAAELILATGTKHDVSVIGDAGGATVGNQLLGSVNLLPPTLLAQWHFNPDQMFDPYVGAGINYTAVLDRNLNFRSGPLAGHKIKIDSDSWGLAAQAGLDVNLGSGWLINADVKYIQINTDVKARLGSDSTWTKIDKLDIDPWVVSVGFGKKF